MFITWLRLVSILTAACCGDLCDPEVVRWYAKLNAAASLNRHSSEHAAFLVRRSRKEVAAVVWQAGDAAAAVHKGRIPAGTIAIAHTHPPTTPEPSRQDLFEAQRLRIPIVVITPDRVMVARTDGSPGEILGSGWRRLAR